VSKCHPLSCLSCCSLTLLSIHFIHLKWRQRSFTSLLPIHWLFHCRLANSLVASTASLTKVGGDSLGPFILTDSTIRGSLHIITSPWSASHSDFETDSSWSKPTDALSVRATPLFGNASSRLLFFFRLGHHPTWRISEEALRSTAGRSIYHIASPACLCLRSIALPRGAPGPRALCNLTKSADRFLR